MLCPYCLEQVTFQEVREQAARSDGFLAALLRFLVSFRKSRKLVGFRCPNPECKQFVPVMYVRDYDRFPPAVVSAVGFSKHGETVFFGSLMHALRSAMLHERWPDSFTLALDDSSLATVLANVRSLDSGHLPPSTANNFPRLRCCA